MILKLPGFSCQRKQCGQPVLTCERFFPEPIARNPDAGAKHKAVIFVITGYYPRVARDGIPEMTDIKFIDVWIILHKCLHTTSRCNIVRIDNIIVNKTAQAAFDKKRIVSPAANHTYSDG